MSQEAELLKETDTLFNREYEQELATWARRRFRNFCITFIVLLSVGAGALFIALLEVLLAPSGDPTEASATSSPGTIRAFVSKEILVGSLIAVVIELVILAVFFLRNRRSVDTSQQLIRSVTKMVMILSVMDILVVGLLPIILLGEGSRNELGFSVGELFFWHLIPCLFLPWKPMQSLKAMIPAYCCFVLLNALIALLRSPIMETEASLILTRQLMALVVDGLALLLFIPGVVICWNRLRRHGKRFRNRMLGTQFLAMRREMAQARTVHDALFPKEIEDENIRFTFEYHPYKEIGGDYVWFKRQGNRVRMVLLDVTGHGLPAAMTVNRISGELERICGEFPNADSLRITELLARYFHLTMAPHRIFATGFVADLDLTTGSLQWVNAGHPPCFILRNSEEAIQPLASNTMMLGAVGPEEFEGELGTLSMHPGDTLICYTDGVSEARSPKGDLLGLQAVEQCLCGESGDVPWTTRLADMARSHSRELLDDDILVTAITLKKLKPGTMNSDEESSTPDHETEYAS